VQAGGPSYAVELGRLDGLVSMSTNVDGKLPPPSFNLDQLTSMFAVNNLSQADMIALSGEQIITAPTKLLGLQSFAFFLLKKSSSPTAVPRRLDFHVLRSMSFESSKGPSPTKASAPSAAIKTATFCVVSRDP